MRTRSPRPRTSIPPSTSLIAEPSDKTLQAAKEAWFAARIPYQQTEAYRFGNPIDRRLEQAGAR